ncbi:hypothetical protein M9435_004478 [Picochlorum sp. BPE23]|nr:hypothetical protein M9435_004478 [Picochlorum sp. BPE23]
MDQNVAKNSLPDTAPRGCVQGDDRPSSDRSSSPERIERVQTTKRTTEKRGSFIPRTCFSFSQEIMTSKETIEQKSVANKSGEHQARRTRRRRESKQPQKSGEDTTPASSIFSDTTKRYLKSSGLHSERIERLLMKYLGPPQEAESTTPCPSPQIDQSKTDTDYVMHEAV